MNNERDIIHFECTISSARNIRILGAAFQCLARLGKDVSLEPRISSRTLTLRCVNDSKTSFVSFEFRGDFFEEFVVDTRSSTIATIKLRNTLSVFRSMKTIEKLHISVMTMDVIKHVVVFEAECKHAIVKSHQFYFEEAEALDAEFDRDGAKHRIRTRPKLLKDIVGRIQGTDEVDFVATAGIDLAIASYHHSLEFSKSVQTVMKIPKNDFEEFEIIQPRTSLRFSVRELRSLLGFCTTVDVADVYLLFNESGAPFMFTTTNRFEESLMVAATGTAMDEDGNQVDQRASGHFTFTLVQSTLDEGDDQNGSQRSQEYTQG